MHRVFFNSIARTGAALLMLSVVALVCGAVSAQTVVYRATMDGASEAPPNSSMGTGTVRAIFNNSVSATTMRLIVNFSGLTGNSTVAHIHCCTTAPRSGTAGVATDMTAFPSGGTSGTYDRTFDMTLTSSYSSSFLASSGGTAVGAFQRLIANIASGNAYFNLHSTTFSGGEIRGFFTLEPSLDVDVSNAQTQYHSLTDGLIMMRYMLTVTGAPLVNGALGTTATRTDPGQIKTYLDATRLAYDIDGNGSVDAATDGVLIVRYLMGIRDNALVEGALGAGATRTLPGDVASYMLALMP
jgi:CHRD domain